MRGIHFINKEGRGHQSTLKILQISDLHGSSKAAESAGEMARREGIDLVFVVGDLTNFGTVGEAEELLGRITRGGVRALFVAGNCDPPELLEYRPRSGLAVNLHRRHTEVGGIRINGLGGSNLTPARSTWIEFEEEEIARLLEELRGGGSGSLLMSHAPPYGAGADRLGDRHAGSTAIRRYVEEEKPILVSCGHIHEARSISMIGETLVVNAGPAKSGWCAVIEVRAGRASASLTRLP